uniref:Uncharacterized protein n=1 Tax=Salix viminalis TaxID=40686 RepID=A0A6N2LJU5_SALVM
MSSSIWLKPPIYRRTFPDSVFRIIMTTLLKVHVRGGLFEKSTDLLIELDTLGFAKEKDNLKFLILLAIEFKHDHAKA